MKLFALGIPLLVISLSAMAGPAPSELQGVYQQQLEALRSNNVARLAATLDEDSCAETAQVLTALTERNPGGGASLILPSITRDTPACEALAQLTLKLTARLGSNLSATLPTQCTVLGTVPEGESIAHAVVRSQHQVNGLALSADTLVSFRRNAAGAWKVLPSTELKLLNAVIKHQLEQTEASSTPPSTAK
jgi:hypothetical protein